MEKLKQVLSQDDTILFIGSGISQWSGLPSWSTMIEELAQFIELAGHKAELVRAEAQRGDLLQAASYGFDKLTKQQIAEFIRSACRHGAAKPHEIHRKIVSLGPRCFVTTNYDNLIEQSLRCWQADRFFRGPITNRQLTEMAEIVHARAIDFIFKPHGDAADSESIILTREQYRQLLPQGERQAALESLKMLLASRPVVYFGFGLRDPDFAYVRDLLANTYKGGTRDHYAIIPDLSDGECDYWRRNYGIHLVGYATTERKDGTRDHTELLSLLDGLLENEPLALARARFDPHAPDTILALARYAAALTRSPKVSPEFPIRVHVKVEERRSRSTIHRWDRFDSAPIQDFLTAGPERAILLGLPGAGKTYALRRGAAQLAERLHEACLSDPFDPQGIVVPVLADLKLYHGDLAMLVGQVLPKSLPLREMTEHFKVKVFIDSFNEMPRDHWESGSYEADFDNFVKSIGRASLIIASRTDDGLAKLSLPTYCLDEIDAEALTAELQRLGIQIEGRFSKELRYLLQRPFYFQHVACGAVRLPREAHPQDFYHAFFENVCENFGKRFQRQFNVETALSLVAYDALNRGQEAFPLCELLRVLKMSMETAGLTDIDVHEVANWLVSFSVLIPHTGGRVAFVHQSLTEYLAASELARRYQSTPHILKEMLSLTRWDQSLLLTLSLLPSAKARVFLQDVMEADLALALHSAKYVEIGRDEVVARLLSQVTEWFRASKASDCEDGSSIEAAIEYGVPLADVHCYQLREIVRLGDTIGAAAATRLVGIKGSAIKDELLQLLIDRCDDFNLCVNGIGSSLKPFATDIDAKNIVVWADSIEERMTAGSSPRAEGFISGAAEFLSQLDLQVIRREFLPRDDSAVISGLRGAILVGILEEHHSTAALDFAAELLLKGVNAAAMAIYFISEYGPDSGLCWASFTQAHIECLVSILSDADRPWASHALKCLCSARPDLAERVKQKASGHSGLMRAALLHCSSPDDLAPVFRALSELTEMNDKDRREQPIEIIEEFELDWTAREELFVKLLKLRDIRVASVLFGGSCPPTVRGLGPLEIGPVDWWLQWMMEVDVSTNEGFWFLEQLGALFADHLTRNVQDEFVGEFNKSDSPFRRPLLHFVLPFRADVTTEMFSEDAISFLLANLNQQARPRPFPGDLLGNAASEPFVTERLLPLLPNAKQPLLRNLHAVLSQAGSRHGRRYVPKGTEAARCCFGGDLT